MSATDNGAAEIWERRKQLGVSREKVAGQLGMTMKTLERKEKGRSPLSELERAKILALYDRMLAAAKAGEAA